MDYIITPEEIYMTNYERAKENKDKGNIDKNMRQVVEQLRKDDRVMEAMEGYFICESEHKKEVEYEYGVNLIPIHPDDFTI